MSEPDPSADDQVLRSPAFVEWLAQRLPGAAAAADLAVDHVHRPAAGQSNDTVLFRLSLRSGAERRLVVRLQPSGRQIFLDADVVREGRVLAGLASSGVPVPAVIGVEPDPDVLGRPFFVMEHVDGQVPLARPSIHVTGWLTTLSPHKLRELWDSAIDALVATHEIDWRRSHDFLLDGLDPVRLLDRHLQRLADWYAWTARGRTYPITDTALARLLNDRAGVAAAEPVLVWADARIGNMIIGDDHRVAAAIDWEVATIGSPAMDLAHWLFFDDFMTTAHGFARLDGWPDAATTIAEYEARSGRRVADLDYFGLMDELFMATTLIRQADFRVERGLADPSTRMGHDNAVTRMLARRLGMEEPDLSSDYRAHRGLAEEGLAHRGLEALR